MLCCELFLLAHYTTLHLHTQLLHCREVNRGGLQGLYQILLEDSGPYFAAALRHISSE